MSEIDKKFQPSSTVDPTASTVRKDTQSTPQGGKWLIRARDAFKFSTTYVDTNYRSKWEDSIKAFNGEHPSTSKYNTPQFEKRSKLYRPKTRAIIRKTEAAAAAAYFSNSDVISIEAENQSDKEAIAAAEVMKELIQHHLTKTVPWFQVLLGGLQDAQVTGSACAHIYWHTKTKQQDATQKLRSLSSSVQSWQGQPEQGPSINPRFDPNEENKQEGQTTVITEDHPMVDLIPIENIRIDPAASWLDPVNTSPYIIHLIPMYVGQVKDMMESGEWIKYSEGTIMGALQSKADTTTAARLKRQGDPYDSDGKTISDYEIVWIQRHIHRDDGIDYDFYTLGDVALLTTPVPLSETVFHGQRPYVIGNCLIETHKVFPASIPELSRGLQEEANEIANQRLDNVKYALNKKWIVARNKQVDVGSLVRNVPGSVTMVDSPDDVREISTPDVTASSYQEQDRINVDMDELLGNFGAGTVQSNKQLAQTASGMSMLNQSANVLVEYTLRTYTETFIEPILNQLVLLEKHYETDTQLLSMVGKRSQTLRKSGGAEVTDEMLQRTLYVRCNVGMGATSPEQKVNKLIMGLTAYTNIAKSGIPNLNIAEVGKEIFGALGYADGTRFISQGDDPQVQQMQQQIQQLQQALNDKQMPHKVKMDIATQGNHTKMAIAQMKEQHQNSRTLVDHFAKLTEKGLGGVAKAGAVSTAQNLPKQQGQQ